MKPVLVIVGIILGAIGGVIAYRAYFIEPTAAIVISESGVRELPDYFRIGMGLVLLLAGAGLAYFSGIRRR